MLSFLYHGSRHDCNRGLNRCDRGDRIRSYQIVSNIDVSRVNRRHCSENLKSKYKNAIIV